MQDDLSDIIMLIDMFKRRHPECKIELFYDINNMKKYYKRFRKIKKQFFEMLSIFYKYNCYMHIFIRLHGYKSWVIIRVSADFNLSQQALNELIELNITPIYSVIQNQSSTIIKLAIYES